MSNPYFEEHKNDAPEVASVIYWEPGVDKERVLRHLKRLMEEGVVKGHDTREYIPAFGAPCFYIP